MSHVMCTYGVNLLFVCLINAISDLELFEKLLNRAFQYFNCGFKFFQAFNCYYRKKWEKDKQVQLKIANHI